jgi:hypothetical protein
MDSAELKSERGERTRTWVLVFAFAAAVLLWGLFLFFAVGDKGPPPWDFGVVDDLPGSSPYSTHGGRPPPTLGPAPVLGSPALVPQHVGAKETK